MIDINKKYRTRDGREVRIYATDGGGYRPIHGAIKNPVGWSNISWRKNGLYVEENKCDADLIEVKEKIKLEGVLTIYKDGSGTLHYNKATAKFHREGSCIAHIDISKYQIEFEEGEGL